MGKSIFNAKEMVSGGVWISPSGDIFGVPLTHVRAVLSDPAKFGLTLDFVKDVYSRHEEGRGSEGDARDEIIGLLVSRGWIRIRYHPGDFGFHIELKRLDRKEKDLLWEWSEKVLSKFPERRGLKVVIDESLTKRSIDFKLGELSSSQKFIESSASLSLVSVPDAEDVSSFPISSVQKYSGGFPSLAGLANLVNAVQGEFHNIHFYASGHGGHWDAIHEIADKYYDGLSDDYDTLCELALQCLEDITHPNMSASAIGFENIITNLNEGFEYYRAMQIIRWRLLEVVDYANDLNGLLGDSGAPYATAACNFLQDFIMRWSKEGEYRTRRRLSTPNPQSVTVEGTEPYHDFCGTYDAEAEFGLGLIEREENNVIGTPRILTFDEARDFGSSKSERRLMRLAERHSDPDDLPFQQFELEEVVGVKINPVASSVPSSGSPFVNTYDWRGSGLRSAGKPAILSMAPVIGAGYKQGLNKSIRRWLLAYTDKVREYFPKAAFDETTEKWKIYDGVEVRDASGKDISGRRLLIEIWVEVGTSHIHFEYLSGARMVPGITNDLKTLLDIIPSIG